MSDSRMKTSWKSGLAIAAVVAIAAFAIGCGSESGPGEKTPEDQAATEVQQMTLAVTPANAPPIIFAGDREKEYRLYAVEPDGSDRVELTSEFAISPDWSADGEQLAFVGSLAIPGDGDDGHNHGDDEEHGDEENHSSGADSPVHGDIGGTDFRLGLLSADSGSDLSEEAGEARGEPMYPSIDPKSDRIFFQVTPGFSRDGGDGRIRSAIDSVEPGQEGVSTILDGNDSYYQPAWSPDGETLAVIVSSCKEGSCEQVLRNYDRSLENSETLVDGGVAGTPAWSNDGGKIAFSWTNQGRSGIWVVEPGGDPRQVTEGKADTGPSFSPDGEQIVFGRKCDIFAVKLDGSGLRNLTRTPKECEITPAWRPEQG